MRQATLWGPGPENTDVYESSADVLDELVTLFVEPSKREHCKKLLIALINVHGNAKVQAAEARIDAKLRRFIRLTTSRGQGL